MSSVTAEIDPALDLAFSLIRMRLRPVAVAAMFPRLGVRRLRRFWRECHHTRPPSGMLPEHAMTRVRSRPIAAHAELFYALYTRFAAGGRSVSPDAIARAYRLYLILAPTERRLDITVCWIIARDGVAGNLSPKLCKHCRQSHVFSCHIGHKSTVKRLQGHHLNT